jgi:hypothetical protein
VELARERAVPTLLLAQKGRVNKYILHGVSDMDLKNASSSTHHGVSTYTLSANKNYSIFFEVISAAGPVNVSHDTFTTYDVQSLSVEEEGGGVLVRGEFMSGSRATGCLVVLQGPPSSPDIFRALLRTQSQDTVSTTVPVPPSTYTVYGYDLEENGLPNTMPAVVLENQILINSDADKVKPSLYLKSASISRRGSTVSGALRPVREQQTGSWTESRNHAPVVTFHGKYTE